MDLKVFVVLFGLFLSCYVEGKETTILEEDVQNVTYYSERWMKLYNKNMLKNQPRWKLSEDQPGDAAYEAREYEISYWVSSHDSCWNQDKANSMGYVNLYFYLMGFNYQGFYYGLTYPIITRVEKLDVPEETLAKNPTGKRRGGKRNRRPEICPRKHTSMLYIRATDDSEVATPAGQTVTSEKLPQRVVYAREYYQNNTSEFCNEQASLLAEDLVQDGVVIDQDDWYCARYVPGVGELDARYEVWFVGEEE